GLRVRVLAMKRPAALRVGDKKRFTQTSCPGRAIMARARQKPATDGVTAVFAQARRHLTRRDPVLGGIISRVGRCTLRPGGDPFEALVRAVVAQMISTAAARSVYARLEATVGQMTPANLLAAGTERVRSAGLSGAKVRALTDLAEHVVSGQLPLPH